MQVVGSRGPPAPMDQAAGVDGEALEVGDVHLHTHRLHIDEHTVCAPLAPDAYGVRIACTRCAYGVRTADTRCVYGVRAACKGTLLTPSQHCTAAHASVETCTSCDADSTKGKRPGMPMARDASSRTTVWCTR